MNQRVGRFDNDLIRRRLFTVVHSDVIVGSCGLAPMETKGLDSVFSQVLSLDGLQWKYRGQAPSLVWAVFTQVHP